MIKLAVLDWNGTLFADVNALVEAVNKELELLGLASITPQQYRQYYDVPIYNLFKALGVTEGQMKQHSQKMSMTFHATYEPRAARTRTRAGTWKLLANLHGKRISCAILSNHTMEGIYFQLERLKLSGYIDAVLANEVQGGAHFKGKQERLEDYLRETKIKPVEAFIAGDTVEEIRIGRNLGLHTIAVSGGANSLSRLQHEKPDFLVNKLTDISKIVENM